MPPTTPLNHPRQPLLRVGLILLSLVGTTLATAATPTSATVRQEHRTVSMPHLERVIVDGLGSVTVVGTASPTVRVSATLQSFARDEMVARQYLDRVRWFADAAGADTVRIGVDPRGLKPMLHPGQEGADGVRVDLRVEVPRQTEVSVVSPLGDISVSGVVAVETKLTAGATRVQDIAGAAYLQSRQGRIDAAGIRGRLQIDTGVGGVSARHVSGPVRVKTGGGAVSVTDAPKEVQIDNRQGRVDVRRTGRLTVRAESSSILAEDIGGSADLQTRNGRISVRRLGGDYLAARTETGAVEVTQPTPTATRYDLHTRNGRIDILLSPSASVDVDLTSTMGRAQTRLPLTNLKQDAAGHHVRGILGDGRYSLKVRSQTGLVRLLPARM